MNKIEQTIFQYVSIALGIGCLQVFGKQNIAGATEIFIYHRKKRNTLSPRNLKLESHLKRQRIFQLLYVFIGLLLASVLMYFTDGDRKLANIIFTSDHLWPGIDTFPWNVLYDWAPLPGFIIVGLALVFCLGGFFSPSLRKWRRETIFLLLLMFIGPGLIVNVLFKDNLGRARPREIIEFGGTHQYTEIWEKGTTGANSSFPSGHASVAFYTMAPWFIFRDKRKHSKNKRHCASSFLVFGIVFGSVVGLARMLQGGHFLSDVLWAGGIVYLVGGVLALMYLPMPQPTTTTNGQKLL